MMYRLLGSGRHACRSDYIPLSLSVHYCNLIKEILVVKQDAFNLTGGRFISHFQSCLAILSMCFTNASVMSYPHFVTSAVKNFHGI